MLLIMPASVTHAGLAPITLIHLRRAICEKENRFVCRYASVVCD